MCSIGVAYVVYFMMGGKVLCDESPAALAPAPAPTAAPNPVSPAPPTQPPESAPPQPILETYMPYQL